MKVPHKPHWDAEKRILKYVHFTIDMNFLFKKSVGMELHDFSNIDLGGDLYDCKSTSGYIFSYGLASALWCIKK